IALNKKLPPRKGRVAQERTPSNRLTERAESSTLPALPVKRAVTSASVDRAARGLDLGLRGGRDLVDLHVQGHGDVAIAEDLDQGILPHEALGHEDVRRDVAALGEDLRDLVQVHDLVLGAERVLEAAKLRCAHVQRHLATLEADAHGVASARSLRTATSRLALRALTATLAGLRGVGAGDRAQVVSLEHAGALVVLSHQSISSTFTRRATART